LTKRQKIGAILVSGALVVGLIASTISILSTLLPNYPWFEQLSNIPIEPIIWVLSFMLILFVATKAFLHYKKSVAQNINKCYHKRLLKDIRLELEKEVTTKNIILEPQEKDEVLQILTEKVTDGIIRCQPQTYKVKKALASTNCLSLDGIVFTITQESEEVIAQKMTELSNSPKYRKKTYRYFSLFN